MKKIIGVILSLILILCMVFTFTACKKENTLIVATNAEFPPFEFTKEDGSYTGIDMDLAAAIAKELGMTLEIKNMNFDSVVTSIQTGNNIGMAALTISAERLESVDFSDPYFKASQMVIAKKNDTSVDSITTPEALNELLKNKKIGFQNGTTAQYYVEGNEGWGFTKIEGATPVGFDSGALAIIAMNNGTIDYVLIDEMPAKEFVKKNSDSVKLVDIKLTDEDYAIAIPKGNTELKDKINAALKKFTDDGTLNNIIKKYYED